MSTGLDINDHGEVYIACVQVSPKWRYLGARLGVLENTLAIIEADYRVDGVERCMSAVIDKWLRRPVGEVIVEDGVLPTWSDLCVALSPIDRVLAEGIAVKHGCNNIAAFCADLYEKEIKDRTVKNSVLRKKGFDELITHLEVMAEQDSECLHTVLQVMENHQLLKHVTTDIKNETNSSEVLLQDECTGLVQSEENDQQQQLSAAIKDISALSVFRKYFPKVCDVVSNTTKLGNDLVAAELISDTVLDSVDSNDSLNRYKKVSKYMTEIRQFLKANDKAANLESFCRVLYQQKLKALDEIADTMLTDIGCPIKEKVQVVDSPSLGTKRGNSSQDTTSKRRPQDSNNGQGDHDGDRRSDILNESDISTVSKALGIYPNWYVLGVHLKMEPSHLTAIERNNPRDCEKAKTDMITAWIDTEIATWNILVEALRTVKNIAKANKIEREFCKK